MFGLITLPYEVLSNIIENISFDDVFHLARTCKHFKYLLTEESISKSIVQVGKLSVWGHAASRCSQISGLQLLTPYIDKSSLFQ
jgi:hypothetical protein